MAKISTSEEIAEIYLKSQHTLFQLALTYVDTLYLAEELVGDAIVAILEKSPVLRVKRLVCAISSKLCETRP